MDYEMTSYMQPNPNGVHEPEAAGALFIVSCVPETEIEIFTVSE
jgi:hypothetical protein